MPTVTTRTLNPLPFDALEPKRFEDLIRQLAYDFRSWRMLEATGRAGGDEGYDARGFEVADISSDVPSEPTQDGDQETTLPETNDRVWLIQCKRERVITPARMRQHLSEISDDEANTLYGLIFAAACDFSKRTRDEMFSWCRAHGISEIHVWGKGEIEDQLFQPKNDNLLFAYFGISLQIRKRSIRTALRATLATKRKVMRHLGDGWHENRTILLRDPDDERYPFVEKGDTLEHYGWCITEFLGNDVGGIKIGWRQYFAYLDRDGKRWDFANTFNDEPERFSPNPWMEQDEIDRLYNTVMELRKFWHANIDEECRGRFHVEGFLKYDDILDIDEKGDSCIEHPHVFVTFKNERPPFSGYTGKVVVPTFYKNDSTNTEEQGRIRDMVKSRTLWMPEPANRMQIFPAAHRKEI